VADVLFQQGAIWSQGDSKLRHQMAHAAKICDANYSGQTLQRVFINWAEQHPTEWKQDQSMGALWAGMAAWPGNVKP